ncbi:SWIM zinc finger family protein [Anatilimnocola floriformis]|uniref:SWIM zinc finger family protein n=1 Tax=Anatilimnocola floriformis TaxID=2948575 RepID=UPI0020C38EFA|nr:SWIM zinc finger family protein [Anatilimnocola floriformis]
MAGHHPFLTRVRAIVRTLDDDALAALANKGLLRRAQKDLETSKPEISGCDDTCVRLKFADAAVEVPELPSKSRCNCPATGVCRHILSALLYLRDDPQLAALDAPVQGELFADDVAATATAATLLSPAEVIGVATDEEIQKWAGKPTLKKAQKFLAGSPPFEIETEAALVIRFPTRNLTCRWLASGGLLGMVCSCQAETVCEHVVAAVLVYQASLGKRTIVVEQTLLEESSGAPRTRAEVLASVGAVLHETVANGIARLSAATAQRLVTLAVSAHGVDLPRLERMLAGLAQEMQLVVRRDAQASTAQVLLGLCRLEALRAGLEKNPLPVLVGQHRSTYYEVGQLNLTGVGAQWWRSKGGYHGVTVYFWDESAKDWASWSESRPIGQTGFDPIGRFRADGPWAGCGAPSEAARSTVRLTNAYRNLTGRLSGRSATQAIVTGPTPLKTLAEKLPVMKNWNELSPRVHKIYGGGLTGATANQELVLIQPTNWGPANFDSLRQELYRPLLDERGHPLSLWLPFTPELRGAVELLEKFTETDGCSIFGAIRMVAGTIVVQPISLLTPDKIIHLNLAQANAVPAAKTKADPAAAEEGVLDVEEDESPGLERQGVGSALSRLIVTAQAELEGLVENGLVARRGHETLERIAQRFTALGLGSCAGTLKLLHGQLTSTSRLAEPEFQHAAAATLLRAYFILQLAAEQESVALAAGQVA